MAAANRTKIAGRGADTRDSIGTSAVGVVEIVSGSRGIAIRGYRHKRSSLKDTNSAQFPTVDGPVHIAIYAVQKLLALAKREFVKECG